MSLKNSGDERVEILPGRGDGTFAPPIAAGYGGVTPIAVDVADFDGDGDRRSPRRPGPDRVSSWQRRWHLCRSVASRWRKRLAVSNVDFGDIDEDGRLDAVMGVRAGNIQFFLSR